MLLTPILQYLQVLLTPRNVTARTFRFHYCSVTLPELVKFQKDEER